MSLSRFRQFIQEDFLLEFVPTTNPPKEWLELFSENRPMYELILPPVVEDDTYITRLSIFPYEEGVYEIEFSVKIAGTYGYQFQLTKTNPKTGLKIFNQVLQGIYWFIKIKQPHKVQFSADEEKRKTLYNNLVSQYLKYIPEYTADVKDYPKGSGTISRKYILTRKPSTNKESITENLLLEFVPTPNPPEKLSKIFSYDGSSFDISFPELKLEIEIFNDDDIGRDFWEVSFSVNNKLKLSGKHASTSLEIFNKVLQTIYWFIRIKSPQKISLYGAKDEEKRIELYDRLMQRYMKHIPNYRLKTKNVIIPVSGKMKQYTLERIRK